MKFLKIILASLATLLVGISAFGQSKESMSAHGFRVVNHTNWPGEKVKAGDQVRLQMSVHLGDTTLMSSFGQGEPPAVPIPDPAQVQNPSPILDALATMANLDSATCYQKVDSSLMQFLPPTRRNVKEIRYELKLVGIVTAAEAEAKKSVLGKRRVEIAEIMKPMLADFAANKIGTKLVNLPSGLQMVVHEVGTGKEVVKGENLRVHYYGCLPDGKLFDNSYERGEPIEFAQGAGQMIPGFDEGAGMLKHGGKATLFIPAKLGYGADGTPDGSIPPNSTIVFYIEVE